MTTTRTTTRITTLLSWLAAKLHRQAAVAVAVLAATEILRLYQAGDPRGIAAVAAIIGTTVALQVATTGRDAATTLATIAAATAASVEALEAIERSLAGIEHAAGLAEESLDLLATTAADLAAASLTGPAGEVRAG